MQPLRMRRDYGSAEDAFIVRKSVNPYLNTSPSKLRRDISKQKDSKKRRLMEEALVAWRTTVPGSFRKGCDVALELSRIARILMDRI